MPKKLILSRHPYFADKFNNPVLDEAACKKLADVADKMIADGNVPDRILHSPEGWTTATAKKFSEIFNGKTGKTIPVAAEDWLGESHFIQKPKLDEITDAAKTVMAVTHQPNIGYLALFLARSRMKDAAYGETVVMESDAESWKDVKSMRLSAPKSAK